MAKSHYKRPLLVAPQEEDPEDFGRDRRAGRCRVGAGAVAALLLAALLLLHLEGRQVDRQGALSADALTRPRPRSSENL